MSFYQTLQHATAAEREIIVNVLGKGEAGAEDVRQVRTIFDRYDTLGRTIARADAHVGAQCPHGCREQAAGGPQGRRGARECRVPRACSRSPRPMPSPVFS